VSALIQAYVRRAAAAGRDTEQIGPFLATFTPHSAGPFVNYAIPADGARPTADDVAALVAAYEGRGRVPRLEYLPKVAPEVEAALLAGGFTVEERLPVMECADGGVTAQPVPAGIELLTQLTDRELRDMITAQREAFGESDPVGDADVAHARQALRRGGLAALARDAVTGEPAGGGVCTPIFNGVTEVAGIAVRPAYRCRGIAAAITSYLTVQAHRAGTTTAFLTPAGEPQERIYRRAGFDTTDEILFASRRVTTR
jgi:GNAT superfamily N-acetyltransferase